MSLLQSPTGHLTNLSTAPFRAVTAGNLVRQMPENTEAGADIGEPVTADFGADAARTHSLEGPDADSFDIDSSSRQLRTRDAATYDYETKPTLEMVMKVTEALGTVVRIAVTVELIDVDEPTGKPGPPELEGIHSRGNPGELGGTGEHRSAHRRLRRWGIAAREPGNTRTRNTKAPSAR